MLESLGLLGLFAIGTFWFWTLLVVESALLFWALEEDSGFGATVSLIVTVLLLQYLGDANVFGYIKGNPLEVVSYVLGYFLFGTLWSFGKWYFFLLNLREKYDEARAFFLKNRNVAGNQIPVSMRNDWKKYWHDQVRSLDHYYEGAVREEDLIPKARNHKARILLWMTYWPWSMVWTLICDVVKKIFKHIYQALQRWYQRIANHVFRGIENDLPPQNPPEDNNVAKTDKETVPFQRGRSTNR